MSMSVPRLRFGWLLVACAAPLLMSLSACGDEEGFALVGDGDLRVAPDVLTFNPQAIGQENIQYLTLQNLGSAPIVVNALDLIARSAEFGLQSVDLPIRLGPGEERVIEVSYTPQDCRIDRGSLVVRSNDRQNREISVALQPADLGGQVMVTPSPVDFGRVPAGAMRTLPVTLANTGTCVLDVNDIFLTGSADFSMTQPAGDGVSPFVPELPLALEPAETYRFDITFAPANDGFDEATLIVRSDDSRRRNIDTPVIANGTAPCIVVTEESGIDFGARFIGEAHAKTITITNCSQRQPLEVSEIGLGPHATLNGADAYRLDNLPDLSSPALLEPGASLPFTLLFEPIAYTPETNSDCSGEGCEVVDGAMLTISSNDEVKTPLDIEVRGLGTNNRCPVAVARGRVRGSGGPWDTQLDTIPLATVELDSSGSGDSEGGIGSMLWEVVERPDDSTARYMPNAQVANPTFFLDLAGRYTFSLRVFDDTGVESCEPSTVTALVVPNEDIHVQLVWTTNNTDVDLHFMRPGGAWDRGPDDCHWKASSPNWGVAGNRDDPSLDIDDVNGFGPENINLNNPPGTAASPWSYLVGVYYYSDHGSGATDVTVRIFIGGVERFANTIFDFRDGQFWDVARIEWPSGDLERINRIYPNGFP